MSVSPCVYFMKRVRLINATASFFSIYLLCSSHGSFFSTGDICNQIDILTELRSSK
jgi:hypothetical protein